MKGRLKALTLCVVMALASFLLPAYAFATQQEGTVYSVGDSAAFTQAVDAISKSNEDNSVIELTGNVDLTDAFTGVETKHVTVRSNGDGNTPPFSETEF